MNTLIRAIIVTLALSTGIVTAQANSYEDAVKLGQVMHPNGIAGSK